MNEKLLEALSSETGVTSPGVGPTAMDGTVEVVESTGIAELAADYLAQRVILDTFARPKSEWHPDLVLVVLAELNRYPL